MWRRAGRFTSIFPISEMKTFTATNMGLWAMQDVHVEADSLIAEVMGVTALCTSSGHHQAVKAVGAGLRVVAVAEDGIVEALEMRSSLADCNGILK